MPPGAGTELALPTDLWERKGPVRDVGMEIQNGKMGNADSKRSLKKSAALTNLSLQLKAPHSSRHSGRINLKYTYLGEKSSIS